jgi:hypothetical protein
MNPAVASVVKAALYGVVLVSLTILILLQLLGVYARQISNVSTESVLGNCRGLRRGLDGGRDDLHFVAVIIFSARVCSDAMLAIPMRAMPRPDESRRYPQRRLGS